jgi:hypothetical protein
VILVRYPSGVIAFHAKRSAESVIGVKWGRATGQTNLSNRYSFNELRWKARCNIGSEVAE